MANKNNLEDMVKKLSKNLPKFIDLNTFEKRTLKIIRSKYKPDAEYKSISGHSNRKFVEFVGEEEKKCALHPCARQKGSELVISAGLFNQEVAKLAAGTGIPKNYLIVYIKGSGKLYKKYIKKLEEEYEI
ncbi:hypothetical protein KY338_02065 [Candidatus Woesearchaeota archaeon]|nr:hypothetical protein [Candidatus Woesearchaeota archaeon]MBW3005937.1 hypothetical protein [Candidatus Woesearchaeota archaeon]